MLGIAGSLREGSDEYQHSLPGVLENARATFADGELVDETARELVRELLAALAWWARILREERKPA